MSPYYRMLRQKLGQELILYPAVGAVIPDEAGRIMLQSKNEEAGWFIPGGAIELGEDPETALVREVGEETGLIVKPEKVVLVFGGTEYRYEYPNGDKVEIIGMLYQCAVVGKTGLPIDSETRTLEYFSKADMPQTRLPYPKEALFTHLPASD